MTEPDWKRVTLDNYPELKEVQEEIGGAGKYERHYAPAGQTWPLLVLTVLPRGPRTPGRTRIAIGGSIKRAEDTWFDESYGVPDSLLDDLAEMFSAVILEAKGGS